MLGGVFEFVFEFVGAVIVRHRQRELRDHVAVCDGARATAVKHERVSQPVHRGGRAAVGGARWKTKEAVPGQREQFSTRVPGDRPVGTLNLQTESTTLPKGV